MASKLKSIIDYLNNNYQMFVQTGYTSKSNSNTLNQYLGNNIDITGKSLSMQLKVKRTGLNEILAFDKAIEDARYILKKINECTEVVNPTEIPLGISGNDYEFVINFETAEEEIYEL